MTRKDVALFLGVGWGCVKNVLKRNLIRRFSLPALKLAWYLAIDDIGVRQGRRYLALVMDLDSGVVIY